MPFDLTSRIWDVPESTGQKDVLRADQFLQGLLALVAGGNVFGNTAFDVPAGSASTPVQFKDSSGNGFTEGLLTLIDFPTSGSQHTLDLTLAGNYKVDWNVSVSKSSGGANEVHCGVTIDGTVIRQNGEGQRTIANNNDTGSLTGHTIINCPNGNELIGLWIESSTGVDLTIEHFGLVIEQKSLIL